MFYLTNTKKFNLSYIRIGHIVNVHTDNEEGNLLLSDNGPLFLAARSLLHIPSHRKDITCCCFLILAQWDHWKGLISDCSDIR